MQTAQGIARSADGTGIVFERSGDGPALVMVDPAGGYSGFDNIRGLGALLALHAAAAGVPIEKLVLFEPPVRDEGAPPETAFTAEIAALVAAGDRAAAADRFLTAIGVPPEVIEGMAPVRPAFEAVAHTLVYDCVISDATDFDLLRSVRTPTLVLDSQGSSDDLTGGAAAIAVALPDGTLRTLTGEWHGVPDEDLAPVVAKYLR